MLVCVVLIVYIVALTNAQSYDDVYVIPEPKIEVFSPKGFRVSIEDSPGVRLFAFHGNINKNLNKLEAGELSRDITQRTNGKWTFEDPNVRLQIGDAIRYWLFVIKDGLGYRLDEGYYRVTGLISTATVTPSRVFLTTPIPPFPLAHNQFDKGKSNFAPEEALAAVPTSPSLAESGIHPYTQMCQDTISNITQSLTALQTQIDKLIKINEQLSGLLKSLPDAKKLTFSGRIQPDDDPVTIVKFLLREKLDLTPHVLSATRNVDKSITFEVTTIDEKLEILEVAKEKLKGSKIILR